MRRDEILAEIARLDEQINRTVSRVELPRVDAYPFPVGIWVFTLACFAWYLYADDIPATAMYHLQTAVYAKYLGWICGGFALLATMNWAYRALSSRRDRSKSEAYMAASRQARELQERRRELQAELRSLTEE